MFCLYDDSVDDSEIMNKDNDRRSRLRLPQVSGVVQETSTSAAAAAAPNACAAKNSTVDPSRNAAPKPTPARRFKLGRNRASPARLFKLNKILVQAQKDLIEEWGWGGMLKVVAKEMPVDLSMWILYLDSLVVDEPVATDEECPIRAAAWNDKLIQIVMHKDSKGNGEFGKLRKKRKIAVIVGELCTDISNRLGTFVESFANLMDEEQGGRRKRQRKDAVVHDEDDGDDEGDDDNNGECESEEDSDGEDDEDDDTREDEDDDNREDDANGRNDNHSTGGTGEDEQDEYPACNLQPPPRRSARLTPQKSYDGPSSNLRKRPCDNVDDNNRVDEVDDNREDEDDADVRNDNRSTGVPPSRVLEESNPILPDPAKASTTIADETTNMQKQNKHVTACADARAQANVDVPIAANHKMPTARPPKANQLQPASSRGTEHQQIPQVMPHCGVPPSKVIQAPQKHAPLPQGIPANREATCPTRESCPPPEPKIKNLDEVTRKRAMLARAPDAPSFDLGFDSPAKFGTYPSYSCGITPVDLDAECFGSEEDDWDETTWKEACDAVDKVEREKGYRQEQPSTDNSFVVPGSGFKTPVVSNTVMELGIESIMLRKDRNVKKIVMPLRVTHLLKDLERNEKELKKHFNKATAHLDRKDSVMLPVLEDLAPDANEPVNHYWLFVINIRDRRFEVLDSIRSLSDRKLAQNVEDILSSVHALWDQYYANSPVKLSRFEGPEDIKPPKQGTK
ncbi:hypothetical protein ACQ4PT_021790 [Festuca glaucescens]